MASKKSKIVCSVKVSRLEFVSLPTADQLQPNFYRLPCVEQGVTKLNWKSTIYSVVKCPWIFHFILLCLIFSRFLILFIYITNIGYWQILFITQEQLGISYPASSTFKCGVSTAAVLVYLLQWYSRQQFAFIVWERSYFYQNTFMHSEIKLFEIE